MQSFNCVADIDGERRLLTRDLLPNLLIDFLIRAARPIAYNREAQFSTAYLYCQEKNEQDSHS